MVNALLAHYVASHTTRRLAHNTTHSAPSCAPARGCAPPPCPRHPPHLTLCPPCFRPPRFSGMVGGSEKRSVAGAEMIVGNVDMVCCVVGFVVFAVARRRARIALASYVPDHLAELWPCTMLRMVPSSPIARSKSAAAVGPDVVPQHVRKAPRSRRARPRPPPRPCRCRAEALT